MRHTATLILAVATLLPAQALAQAQQGYGQPFRPGVELVGLVGYHISSDLNFATGSASIDGSPSYGASIRARLRPGETAELLWVIVPTNTHVRSSTLGTGDASLTINYFQIGGSKGFRSDRLEPYFSGTIGAAVYAPGTLTVGAVQVQGSDVWRFAFTVGGGLKIWLHEKVALQAEARLMAPVWFSSAAFYSGPGGAAFGVSGGIPVVEGNFTGGLVIAP